MTPAALSQRFSTAGKSMTRGELSSAEFGLKVESSREVRGLIDLEPRDLQLEAPSNFLIEIGMVRSVYLNSTLLSRKWIRIRTTQ